MSVALVLSIPYSYAEDIREGGSNGSSSSKGTLIKFSSVIPSEAELPVFGQFREVEEPFDKLRAGSAFVFPGLNQSLPNSVL